MHRVAFCGLFPPFLVSLSGGWWVMTMTLEEYAVGMDGPVRKYKRFMTITLEEYARSCSKVQTVSVSLRMVFYLRVYWLFCQVCIGQKSFETAGRCPRGWLGIHLPDGYISLSVIVVQELCCLTKAWSSLEGLCSSSKTKLK